MLQWLKHFFRKSHEARNGSAIAIDYDGLFKRIGYRFNDTHLVEQALKHRSILPVLQQERVESNERLELLGDAVLGLIVTEFLYHRHPKKEEGELTAMKSLLVSRKILAGIAREMDLGSFLLLSESEIKTGGRKRQSIVADALEALIGAIYLDGGLEAARSFILKKLLKNYERILNAEQHKNFKSILLEYAQSRNLGTPFYLIRSEKGPDHNKIFTVEVRIQNKTVGVGVGNSKKRAEQKAAQDALEKLEI